MPNQKKIRNRVPNDAHDNCSTRGRQRQKSVNDKTTMNSNGRKHDKKESPNYNGTRTKKWQLYSNKQQKTNRKRSFFLTTNNSIPKSQNNSDNILISKSSFSRSLSLSLSLSKNTSDHRQALTLNRQAQNKIRTGILSRFVIEKKNNRFRGLRSRLYMAKKRRKWWSV